MSEKLAVVKLTFDESGALCHLMMQTILANGGLEKQPPWVITLYNKLAAANDRARP